jgi:hypothetical protein
MTTQEKMIVDQFRSEIRAAMGLVFEDPSRGQLKPIDGRLRACLKSQLLRMKQLASEYYTQAGDQDFRSLMGGIVAAIEFDQHSNPQTLELAAALERANL